MKTQKLISIIATIAVVGGAIVYLIGSSFGESMVYYKTVAELLDESERFDGRSIRVNGLLVENSIRQKPNTDEFKFQLTKQGQKLDFAYSGVLPDAMQPGREIVVHGKLLRGQNLFIASEILTKCPSKYEAEAKSKGP